MRLSRRDFLATLAACALPLHSGRAAGPGLDDLLAFPALGQVTLLHLPDLHAQLTPLYLREPLPDPQFAAQLAGLADDSPLAYALRPDRFEQLAASYGRLGGVAHLATLIAAIRAERPGRTLLFDGGDSWQGSYGALQSQGKDMLTVMQALGIDAMTGHWEFTYGAERVQALFGRLSCPFLAGNVRDTTWNEPVFTPWTLFERGGLLVAVIGQAYPYTPIANPRHLIPDWSFGIHEDLLRQHITEVRAQGADLVVLLSHNGLAVDCALAGRVAGLDVILSGHTHEALPAAIQVADSLIITGGSHGKVLARLDIEVQNKRISAFRFAQIPVLSQIIPADPAMAALVASLRQPHDAHLRQPVGHTSHWLTRRGTLGGSFDHLLCAALLEQHEAEIALSPGFRWGGCVPAGQEITREDLYSQTAITYAASYRRQMSGAQIKEILEDVADNLFHPNPYYRQGGDMVRTGGLSYRIDPRQPIGQRIQDLRLARSDNPLMAEASYVVAGWASVAADGADGPPMWQVAEAHLRHRPEVEPASLGEVALIAPSP